MDDFIFIGPQNSPAAQSGLFALYEISEAVGIPFKHEKTVPPTTCAIVHGIEVNTTAQEACLPVDKLNKGVTMISQLSTRKKVSLKELQEALGFLNFVCNFVTPGRAFLRRLTDLTRGLTRPHHYVRLSQSARADLSAWYNFLASHNGISVLVSRCSKPSCWRHGWTIAPRTS